MFLQRDCTTTFLDAKVTRHQRLEAQRGQELKRSLAKRDPQRRVVRTRALKKSLPGGAEAVIPSPCVRRTRMMRGRDERSGVVSLSGEFSALYACMGQPSSPPEKLLRATPFKGSTRSGPNDN
jgi:hypothetical protein